MHFDNAHAIILVFHPLTSSLILLLVFNVVFAADTSFVVNAKVPGIALTKVFPVLNGFLCVSPLCVFSV